MVNVFLDNSKIGGHNNLILEIPSIGLKEEVDTYYFALDNGFRENDESTKKMVDNLIHLLKKWISEVEQITTNQFLFLPFDFSDQYIGLLEVRLSSRIQLSINYSVAIFNEGLPYSPSNYPDNFDLEIADSFHKEKSVLHIKKEDFIRDIEGSIKDLERPENYIEWMN